MESIGDVIHKRKEAKEKQKDKSQLPVEHLSNCTNGEGSTTVEHSQADISTEVNTVLSNKRGDKSRSKQLTQSAEIDDYITGLIIDDAIDPEYTAWVAKCCYALTVPVVHRLLISARSGRDPKRLFAFKLKAGMQLHYKRQFESMP